MKRLFRANLALWGIVLGAGVVAAAVGINASQQPKKIRVMYTVDTLGYLEPCG